ncbi:ATP-binding cassette domain-containing protein [Lactococcus nasutitermitis]|uniref:ATP-binding cassette domain-containing protein n=1 Tax=Lactococcus nasutitermitis TaxID=1652957 RepID=A0ABV9JB59_9LACT|nr:ATP-binding cassette domain-containing protein [Lactococcus nasutitermitis]
MDNIGIKQVSKRFSDKIIMEEANITFSKGKISFIMGPNGIGKTTLIKIFMGLQKLDKGIIINPYKNNNSFVLFDDLSLYQNLTGYRNIQLFTSFKFSKKEIKEISQKYLSDKRLNKNVRNYSLGEGKKLSLIIWVLLSPPLSIMDEVTNGLDYQSLTDLRNKLLSLKKDMFIILTGHDFAFYESIIDELYVFKNHKIIKDEVWKEKGLGETYEHYFTPRV